MQVRKQESMRISHQHFAAVVSGGRLFKLDGLLYEGDPFKPVHLDRAERYDFSREQWSDERGSPMNPVTREFYVNENDDISVVRTSLCYAWEQGTWSKIKRDHGGKILTTPPPKTKR